MIIRLLGFFFIVTGLSARTPWTQSKVLGSPEIPSPFLSETVESLNGFQDVLEIVGVSGRVLLVENTGKIWSVPADLDAKQRTLVADLKSKHPTLDHAYGLALHPEWQKKREVFVTYTLGAGVEDGTKLSRFKLKSLQPLEMDLESEEVLLTWLSGGHNGAHLQFGPDGLLYVSTGDAEVPAPPDPRNTGQDNRDLLSCILRLDVDHREGSRKYAIPPDNPYLNRSDVRPEIWAFGFRNPWKMSFDSQGRLWCGDVGWELWEMIHLVGRGTNHGWSAMEATQAIKPEAVSPLAPITAPIIAHPHTEAASITGGYVYHGQSLPELRGAYIYGDYETGKIWALWYEAGRITRHEEIADTPHKIVSFGLLPDGEIIYAHWGKQTTFHRLVRRAQSNISSTFPKRLSETGLFSDTQRQKPADGVYEYGIAEPMWHDGLTGRRFIALPAETRIEATVSKRPDGTTSANKVVWPANAVLAKTLSTHASEPRLIETQILHFDGEAWNGYSYRWNEKQTDAELVGLQGSEIRLTSGAKEPLSHRFHARAECARCHTSWAGFTLGFQPQQLTQIDGKPAMVAALNLGLVSEAFFEISRSRVISSRDTQAPLEQRARSWLHANCAHCHRQHGGGSVALKVNVEQSLLETELLGEKPLRGEMGIPEARLIAPGVPSHSALLARIARTGVGRMPILGSDQVDDHGYALLWSWIESLSSTDTAALAKHPLQVEAPKVDASTKVDDVPKALTVLAKVTDQKSPAFQSALASEHEQIRPLFERFQPPEKRRQKIGLTPDEKQLLSTPGMAERGASLLQPAAALASCFGCHFINGTGRDLGPDLTHIGARLNRQQLLESLLHPSQSLADGFALQVVELQDGSTQSGFLLNEKTDRISLKSLSGVSTQIEKRQIKMMKPQVISLMPEGLLQSLTAQEVADLLSYLESLK